MKLVDLSSRNGDLAAEVARTMAAEHPLVAALEFYQIVGNADNLRKASAATGGTVRAVNNNYTGVAVDPAYATPSLKIFGDEIKVDQAFERRGMDIVSVRRRDLAMFARRASKNLADFVINGTGNSNQPTGLKTITPSGQKFFANTSSTALTLELGNTDAKKLVHGQLAEKLRRGISMVDGGARAIIVPTSIVSRLTSILADQVQWVQSEYGVPIAYFNRIPIIEAGYKLNGAEIIAGDETAGTISGTCYSIYFVRFGEAADVTVATSNGVNVTDKGLVGSQYVHNVELDLELALENDLAVAKLEGIKIG
jgi:hypothetical protein